MNNDISNNWVYQSNKLVESIYQLTPLEHKLLRILISMIKKEDEEFTEYKFSAKELNKFLKINPKNIYLELDQATDRLMTRFVKIKDDKKETFKKRHLIEVADYENGVLTLKIHSDMKPFYLQLQEYYTKYKLKNILKFKSMYSFRFYELLKQYEDIGYRIFSVAELREILDIQENQYPKYANLKQKVITVAIKEINNYTDLFIEIEEIKEVRKVEWLKFKIKKNKSDLHHAREEQAATIEVLEEVKHLEQVKELIGITDKDAEKLLQIANGDINLIKTKYDIARKQGNIKNIVAWLIDAIKNNYIEPKRVKNKLVDYEGQRKYDVKELEEKLVYKGE